jgi:hypothetical protein
LLSSEQLPDVHMHHGFTYQRWSHQDSCWTKQVPYQTTSMHCTPVQAPDAEGSHWHSCDFQSPPRQPIQPGQLHVNCQEQHQGIQQIC